MGVAPPRPTMSRIFALTALRAFFFGVIKTKYPSPFRLRTRRRSNPRNPKASPFNVSTTLVFSWFSSTPISANCSRIRCRARSAQAPFRVVAADGDDDIIGEPMIVHGLVASLCRFAANRVKEPVHLVQIDVRRQRAEDSPLRDTDLSADFDDLLHQVQDLGVLDSLRDLA